VGSVVNSTPLPLCISKRDPTPIVQEAGSVPEPAWTAGMSVLVHGLSKATKSCPFSPTRRAGSSEALWEHIRSRPWLLFMFTSPSAVQIPVAARSKAWDCNRLLAGIAGSNLAWGMDVCLLWVLCAVRQRSLRRAESYRVWCAWVWSWSPDNKKALAR
jgi:hypothetical protein